MRMRRGIPLSQWVWLRELVGSECVLAIARAAMKRALSSSDEASTSEAKKRKVRYATYQKWKGELDRDCQTVSWLDCESKVVAGKRIVSICPTIFEKWPIKIDFVLTNGLPSFRPYFVLCCDVRWGQTYSGVLV